MQSIFSRISHNQLLIDWSYIKIYGKAYSVVLDEVKNAKLSIFVCLIMVNLVIPSARLIHNETNVAPMPDIKHYVMQSYHGN